MGKKRGDDSVSVKALQAAKEAALLARSILMGHFGKLSKVEKKYKAGLVSEADRESEEAISQYLRTKFPDFDILGEEYGLNEAHSGENKPPGTWIIDPLDGTTNYVHQFPIFCISIGLQMGDEIVAGVIDVPILERQYTAALGHGAFCNDEPLSVSGTKDLGEALVSTGFYAEDAEQLKVPLKIFSHMLAQTRGVRRPGAAAYDLCMVAEGVFDAFWERDLNPWDTAAGLLLVKEAGGNVSNYEGENFNPFHKSIVATNSHLHSQIVQEIGKACQ